MHWIWSSGAAGKHGVTLIARTSAVNDAAQRTTLISANVVADRWGGRGADVPAMFGCREPAQLGFPQAAAGSTSPSSRAAAPALALRLKSSRSCQGGPRDGERARSGIGWSNPRAASLRAIAADSRTGVSIDSVAPQSGQVCISYAPIRSRRRAHAMRCNFDKRCRVPADDDDGGDEDDELHWACSPGFPLRANSSSCPRSGGRGGMTFARSAEPGASTP